MRVLIFGTVYAATEERAKLARQWVELHRHLNPECDFLLVDSASPFPIIGPVWSFPDNIGHLSHGGGDGWGRAFCHGLQTAIDGAYDYVVHIEGDSLFKLPVLPIVRQMGEQEIDAASTLVSGTKRVEIGWVETGLMFFRVGYLVKSEFIKRYNWRSRKRYPNTPEKVIFDLLKDNLRIMPWIVCRGDLGQITVDRVLDFDWVTHCSDPLAYDRFVRAATE